MAKPVNRTFNLHMDTVPGVALPTVFDDAMALLGAMPMLSSVSFSHPDRQYYIHHQGKVLELSSSGSILASWDQKTKGGSTEWIRTANT